MLLTITYTQPPATDLGYLLHKHPDRVQSFSLAFGQAHVLFPEATDERCTAALLLDIDPIALVRGRHATSDAAPLEQYVNDRPYVASSFLSVAIGDVFGTALAGRSKERPELAQTALPLSAKVSVLPCRGGESILRNLFEPLGYTITMQHHALDEKFPEWGNSNYFTVTLEARCRLSELLTHLYVLIPVLDAEKHYWFGEDEVEKLLRRGEGWLVQHPERELIVRRYLKRRHLVRAALARLMEEDESDLDVAQAAHEQEEAALEGKLNLHEQRLGTALAVLKQSGSRRVLDLGCGEGRLLELLLREKEFEEIIGMDVSYRALEIARERLHLEGLSEKQKARIKLIHGALTYRDKRLAGYDAAAVLEVIEHLDPARLATFERVLFEFARPRVVVLTTPNVEYNVKFTTLPAGRLRHRDHRFEWTRNEFQTWATKMVQRFGYNVRFLPIGPEDPTVGAPTQMGVFTQ